MGNAQPTSTTEQIVTKQTIQKQKIHQHQTTITIGPFSLPVDIAPADKQTRKGLTTYFHYEQVYQITSPLIIQVSENRDRWFLRLGDKTIGWLKCSRLEPRLALIPKPSDGIYFRVTFPQSDVVVMEAITRQANVHNSPLFNSPFVMSTRHFSTYLMYSHMSLLHYLSSLPDYYGRHKMIDSWRRSLPPIMTLKFLSNPDINLTCNDYRHFYPQLKQTIGSLYMLRRRNNCVWSLLPRVLLPSIIQHIV